MTTVRLEIEYDGSRFKGWARQADGIRTVQGELEAALATVLRVAVTLTVAGRTDTGVHARGQVASFDTAAKLPADLIWRLNGLCPEDIAVIAVGATTAGFDARRDARSRSYRYRVLAAPTPSPFERGRAFWWPYRLDREALDACAAALVGRHDFTAFTPTQTDHVHFKRKVLEAAWSLDEPSVEPDAQGKVTARPIVSFRVTADAFMRSMVRALVGTQLEVATGRRSLESFERLLEGAPRAAAGETAPPHGLYLESVAYD